MPSPPLLARQALAEFLGSAGLVAVVIGSGIAAQRLPFLVRVKILSHRHPAECETLRTADRAGLEVP